MDRIRMIGYDAVHPADFVYDVPERHGYYLLILTHTKARFWTAPPFGSKCGTSRCRCFGPPSPPSSY
jgi:hypothetical protein